jgi:putative ABC transport system permease protein
MAIAIILSCLGLFGLVAMAVNSKRNEIGIRKVLGAQVSQIIGLYSWKYARLVLVAFLVAIPLSHIAINQWLSTFAHRVEIGVEMYFVAGLITVFIAAATILFKVIEAATLNPADVLRDN